MKKALSIILCLALLVSVIPANVLAAPAAVVTGDTAYEAGEEQGYLSEDTCAVKFDAGTSADVSNMPADTVVNKNSTYVLPESMPVRDGYIFNGWVRSLGSSETVTSSRIAQDTTFYATWAKGGYIVDFSNPGDTIDQYGAISFADGNSMYFTDAEDIVLDTEKGEVSTIVNGNDYYFSISFAEGNRFSVNNMSDVTVGYRSNAGGPGVAVVYYSTEDETGKEHCGISDNDMVSGISFNVEKDDTKSFVLNLPMSGKENWKDYLKQYRVDFFQNSGSYPGKKLIIEYIKFPGTDSVEVFDLNMTAPVPAVASYGTEAIEENSKFEVVSVDWEGQLVAGKYFDGETAYTAKIVIKAKDGYALSDSPALARVNGKEATIVSDGETATVTYTFPATAALLTVQVRVSTEDGGSAEINEAWGTLQLKADVRAQGGQIDRSVIWSIPEEYAEIATVDENGLVSAIYNCDALPVVATSKYDHKTTGTINVKITNQSEPVTVTFNGGTGDGETVRYLPEPVKTKGFYTLPADTASASRTNYAFKGWAKVPGGEIIKQDFVTEDTEYYAVWGYTKADQMQSASGTGFTAANSDGTFTAAYKSISANNKADPPTPALNYTIVTPTNADVSKGVIFYADREGGKTLFSKVNRVPLDNFEYIEMRTTLAPAGIELTAGIATSDEDGSNATELMTATYAGEALEAIADFDGEWYSYKIPTADFDNWENYLEKIKLSFVKKDADGNAVDMDTFNADFIRLVGRDIPVIDVELDAPIAATEFTGSVTEIHDGYEFAGIEWSPALLDGKYFAGNTEYTAEITLNVIPGYFMFPRAPESVLVNGNEAQYERPSGNNNKRAVLTYTFDKTEDVDFEIAIVTYYEKNNDGTVTKSENFIVGTAADLSARVPENIPYGFRWIGWSLSDGGELITENLTIEEDTEIYAVYEVIDGYDFSDVKNISDAVTAENGTVDFDGTWAVITPEDGEKAALAIEGFNLSAAEYDFVEIVFDANRSENGGVNKFDEALIPELTITGGLGEYAPSLEKSEAVIANNTLSRKYTYNLTGDGRTSKINSISVVPYEGGPIWAVASVKFIKNTAVSEDIAVTDLEEPMTWAVPDTTASINGNYTVKSVVWESEDGFTADGSFAGGAVYTATIIIDTAAGYMIDTEVVTVNGEVPDSIVMNDDGTITAVVTYPATDALIDFTFTVADAQISTPEGTAALVAEFTADIPVKDIIWEITSNGDAGNSAVIDENGVVKASYDGVVTVSATSVYDPTKTATSTVTITNQVPYFTVHFDANTTSEVSGMPEDAHVKYDYVLPNTPPVRDGFVFAGWIENPNDKLTVTKAFIEADKTYYALWVSGVSIEFFNESIDSKLWKYSESSLNAKYNEADGTFTFNPANPVSYINTDNKDPLFAGKENTVVEVRLKVSKGGDYSVCCWFESEDANGNVLGPSYDTVPDRFLSNAYQYIPYTFTADTYKTIQFDFSGKSDWVDGYPTRIRFDFPSGITDSELTVTIDYIRIVSYETNEVEITGIDVPAAKAVADTDAVSKDASKYTVTSVQWKEELLHGLYHDANTEYTVQVNVKGAPGYVMSSAPTKATINGKPAVIGAYNGATGELTIEYTFPATENANTSDYNIVTLSSKDEEGAVVEEDRVIFAGDKLPIGSLGVGASPAGSRFIGWADTENAVLPNVTGSVEVTEAVTYYAVYEEITSFDYSNPYHTVGTEAKFGSKVSFDGTYAVVTPAHVEASSAISTPVMNLDGTKFGKVELYFSATMDSTVGTIHYPNKFSTTLEPELKFSTMEAPGAFENVATLIGAERVIIDGKALYKYTYDMTTSAAWNGAIASLYTNPYGNIQFQSNVKTILYPVWGLALIKFIGNDEAPAAEFEFDAPETWRAPATAADVVTSDAFIVTELTWSPAVNDVFNALGVYTAKLTYRADAGYKITDTVATINGQEVEAVYNGDGTYTATVEFPATENLKEVEVEITGADKISDAGRYVQLTGKTVAVDGSDIPVADVTWSIIEGDEYATVSENGRVYPKSNGTVVIEATSVYDEYVSATHTIEITGQKDLVTITFDKNTQADVTGMPAPVMALGTFVPEAYNSIKRDGFIFLGWSADEDAVDVTESFNITEDTTLYAKWGRGYEWSFDNEATSLPAYSGKTMTFNDGIATIKRIPGEEDQWGILIDGSNLSSLELETSVYTQLAIRYSQPASDTALFYFATGDNKGHATSASEQSKVYEFGRPANAPGEFQTVSFNMSLNNLWANSEYPYVDRIRFDNQVLKNDENAQVQVDWVRLYNLQRTVEFNANGGLLSLFGGEVNSYKGNYNNGESIALPANPTREGFEFLGWAKKTEGYNKLYNGKFTVTDNVVLYAIWAPGAILDGEEIVSPDEEVTVTVEVADEMVVGENQTIVVKVTGDINATGDEGVVLTFVDENGVPHAVTISETLESTIIYDLSGDGFEGTVRDVVLTLPTGTTNGLTVEKVAFTTPENAGKLAGVADDSDKPINPGTSSKPGSTESEHPGHNSYPSVDDTQMMPGGISTNNSSESSQSGETPERPKDEDIIMGGDKKDPGNAKFPFSLSYDNRFEDVNYSHWFFDDVINSYELGFMNGVTETLFAPGGTVTVAQAVAVAARIHSTYNGTSIPVHINGDAWYQRYVNYAKSKVIITDGQFTDFGAPITREQIANLFVRVAPASWFTPINSFTTIPDMGENAAILRLYNAGIMIGVDDEYNFNGKANITRAEFSAVINRIALINSRIKVELPAAEETPEETPIEAPVEKPVETPEAAEA